MSAQKKRRERLFSPGKPKIRPAAYDDIRWMWAAAKRAGFDGDSDAFNRFVEPFLAGADKVFMLEDTNAEFANGSGPVGIVLANYDGWALVPHVVWFDWATARNILRCTVGFLQAMRYAQGTGIIKINSSHENNAWFKWLKRYIPIYLAGRIPHGREDGDEYIFYLRGRQKSEQPIQTKDAFRWQQGKVRDQAANNSAVAGGNAAVSH